jgi:hypothetical protein
VRLNLERRWGMGWGWNCWYGFCAFWGIEFEVLMEIWYGYGIIANFRVFWSLESGFWMD